MLVLVAFIREKPLGEPLRVILGNLAVSNIVIAGIGEPMVCISGFSGKYFVVRQVQNCHNPTDQGLPNYGSQAIYGTL